MIAKTIFILVMTYSGASAPFELSSHETMAACHRQMTAEIRAASWAEPFLRCVEVRPL